MSRLACAKTTSQRIAEHHVADGQMIAHQLLDDGERRAMADDFEPELLDGAWRGLAGIHPFENDAQKEVSRLLAQTDHAPVDWSVLKCEEVDGQFSIGGLALWSGISPATVALMVDHLQSERKNREFIREVSDKLEKIVGSESNDLIEEVENVFDW